MKSSIIICVALLFALMLVSPTEALHLKKHSKHHFYYNEKDEILETTAAKSHDAENSDNGAAAAGEDLIATKIDLSIPTTKNLIVSSKSDSQSMVNNTKAYCFSDDWDKTPAYFYPSDGLTWMERLSNTKSISEVYIPGTHESGARFGGAISRCQTLKINQQLQTGVRFLDFRVKPYYGKLQFFHGIQNQDLLFEDALKDVIDLLQRYPKNFIIMRLRLEDSDNKEDMKTFFMDVYRKYSSYFYSGGESYFGSIKVKDIRGKILLLENDWNSGLTNRFIYGRNTLNFQDEFDLTPSDAKTRAILNFRQDSPDKLNLNYFSQQFYWRNGGFNSPEGNACKGLNFQIENPSSFNFPQVMIFDFITGYLAEKVYKKNFNAAATPICLDRGTQGGTLTRKWCFNNAGCVGKNDYITAIFDGTADIKCVDDRSSISYAGSFLTSIFDVYTANPNPGCNCYATNFNNEIRVVVETQGRAWGNFYIGVYDFNRVDLDTVGAGVSFRIGNVSPGNWQKNMKNRYTYGQTKFRRDWDDIGDDFAWWGDRGSNPDGLYKI